MSKHRFSNRRKAREAILYRMVVAQRLDEVVLSESEKRTRALASEPTDRQEIESQNTGEWPLPDASDEECDECGHGVDLHMDQYGCQFERGDIVINECTVAGGPCSCKAHEAKFAALEAIRLERNEVRANLENLRLMQQKLSSAYSILLVNTRTNVC